LKGTLHQELTSEKAVMELNIADLASGVYFIEVINNGIFSVKNSLKIKKVNLKSKDLEKKSKNFIEILRKFRNFVIL